MQVWLLLLFWFKFHFNKVFFQKMFFIFCPTKESLKIGFAQVFLLALQDSPS
jgi:hypothetical protein